MTLGLSLAAFTQLHVIISLVGIASGFAVAYGLIKGKRMNRTTAVFLVTTILTSVTGFGFPIVKFGPPHWIGVISLVVLAFAVAARYPFRLEGSWRWVYVFGAILAQYLNVFVLVVQMFQKIDALHALAPTQAEPPFAIAQLGVLAIHVAVAFFANARFRGAALQTA